MEEKQTEAVEPRIKVRDLTTEGAAKDKELRNTKRFHMSWIDEDDVTQEGEFTIKRPNLGEQARIGTLCAEMREDKPLSAIDRSTLALHEWIATCSVVVIKAPPWFRPTEMFDSEPLQRVYEVALDFHASFRTKRVG